MKNIKHGIPMGSGMIKHGITHRGGHISTGTPTGSGMVSEHVGMPPRIKDSVAHSHMQLARARKKTNPHNNIVSVKGGMFTGKSHHPRAR